MAGVSLEQWRANIGVFHRKKVASRSLEGSNNYDMFITVYLTNLLHILSEPIKLLFNLLLLFSYCAMIVIVFPVLFMTHSVILICFYDISIHPSQSYFSLLQPLPIFLGIQLLPKTIYQMISRSFTVFGTLSIITKNIIFFMTVLQILLFISGTVEINPGPLQTKKSNLSFAVWNLDSLPARDFARIPLIESFQASYDFDLFGVCESSLRKDITNEDIFIGGFAPDPYRSDKPIHIRNGGACLYYKENLPIKERCDLETLPETIVAEVKLNRKKIFFVLSYCHPILSKEDLEEYINGLENIYNNISKENPAITIITGDFNARSPLFWENDNENSHGRALNNFLISNNLDELINEPTNIRDDGSQSCIDLICTNQPYFFIDSGVLPTLDPHSKHNIIHGTLNFNMPCPPPYKRKVWLYKSAKTDSIREELSNTDWHTLFNSLDVNEMSLVFTDVVLSIFSKHIDNKIITINNKDAPWITPTVKSAIRRNTRVYKKWVKRGRNPNDQASVREVQNHTNKLIRGAKRLYYKKLGTKLSDSQIGPKTFWNAFRKISNKKKNTNIPPIIENDVYISNFQHKATLFNEYFAEQCKIHDNGSVLPEKVLRTNASISHFNIDPSSIVDIIRKYNVKKAHGCDEISVAMLQLSPNEIAIPLSLIFQKCISTGMFPDSWKLANVQPVHKKRNRQLKTNYRPISLLPVCGKILEKIIFDQVYPFLNNNGLISKNQSGFRPGESTIYQLIDITSNIYNSFEKHDETRALFLDISKAFDKVWHAGLLHKLKCNGISGNLYNLLENYLQNRQQRVVLNGICSDWKNLEAGVPQGSVLGPLLFLIYINDLTDNISSEMRLFADDSSLFTQVEGVNITHEKLSKDLVTISTWAYQWKMVFNPDITKQAIEVIFSVKKIPPQHPALFFSGIPVSRNKNTKHLGFYLDSRLNFSKHIREAVKKATKGISILKFLSKYVSRKVLDLSYKLYVRPHLDYGDVIYHNQRTDLMNLIEQVQYKAALIVSGCWQGTSRERLYDELGWESLSDRRWFRRMTMFYKISNGMTPDYLVKHIPINNPTSVTLRRHAAKPPFSRTERYDNSFFPYCIKHWNLLDDEIKSLPSLNQFKTKICTYIRPKGNAIHTIQDQLGVKLLTKIRVNFSDLRDHRFNHRFNCENPICVCGLDDETPLHYFLCCPRYINLRRIYLGKISATIGTDVTVLPKEHLLHILMYGSNIYNNITNKLIISQTIIFIRKSNRFKKLEAFG